MKKLLVIILSTLFIGFSSSTIAAEIAPDWFDRYDMPKESIVDPFIRRGACSVSHAPMAIYCLETIRCPEGSYVVAEYTVLMEFYTTDTGENRARIRWWEYVIAGETYRFELDETKSKYVRE